MRAVDWSVVVDRRAASVWAAAVLVYVSAIFGRTSFGVAGVQAMDHFAVDASRIAVFASVQVGVYALAQMWADFRVAWAAVVVVWFVWLVCFAVARRRVTAGAAPGGR